MKHKKNDKGIKIVETGFFKKIVWYFTGYHFPELF